MMMPGLEAAVLAGGEQVELLVVEVVDPLEGLAHADRPGQRGAFDLQLFLDLGQEVERRPGPRGRAC